MKEKIIQIIYSCFDEWLSHSQFACAKGCDVCCTGNVTITALEGEQIIDFCLQENGGKWLAEKLSDVKLIPPPAQTTNEYATSIFNGEEGEQDLPHTDEKCPFLEESLCSIYPVRPFSCRCFNSTERCRPGVSAVVSEKHIYGSIALQQILEHLGQFEYWGHMSDVLLSLSDQNKYLAFSQQLPDPAKVVEAQYNLRTAQPLPGFIIPDEFQQSVNSLLQTIFSTKIGEKSVEQILNGQ